MSISNNVVMNMNMTMNVSCNNAQHKHQHVKFITTKASPLMQKHRREQNQCATSITQTKNLMNEGHAKNKLDASKNDKHAACLYFYINEND